MKQVQTFESTWHATRPAPRTSTPHRPCYIHVGTHKTGTTSIQVFLASNRERFLAHDVFWPRAGSDRDPGVASHHELARELKQSAPVDSKHDVLDAVADELRRSDARVACLSSEDLTFLWDRPAALIRLREAVCEAGFEPRIVIYLRPQAQYCTAVYAENVRHGYRTAFADYLNDVLTRGQYLWGGGSGPPFDYPRLLDAFEAVFGRDRIIVRRYSAAAPDNALLVSFANMLLPESASLEGFTMPATRYNGSLDFGGVLTRLGADHAIGERVRFAPLTISQTLRFGIRFGRTNAAIAARYGVRVPAFEPLDLGLALPIRRTRSKTQALVAARHTLARTRGPS